MNEVKIDELWIYGEYARRAKNVAIDFYRELFAQKIYAENIESLPLGFSRTLGPRAFVRQRGKCRLR